jgi:tetratricopeptide (TPR) repeat protein
MRDTKVDALVAVLQGSPRETDEALVDALSPYLAAMDSLQPCLEALREAYTPEDVCGPTDARRWWEVAGLYYMKLGRFHDALACFEALYNHMLDGQAARGERAHKGMPLC